MKKERLTGTRFPKGNNPPPKQTYEGKKLREYRKRLRHFGGRKS